MFTQQPDQKNLLLAIVLSMGVLLLWQYFYAGPKLKEEQERLKQKQQQSQTVQQPPGAPGVPATGAPGAPGVPSTPAAQAPGTTAPPQAGVAPGVPAATMTRADALGASPRVGIETPAVKGTISLKGGRIDDLELIRYRDTVDPKSPNVVLFSPLGSAEPYFVEKGWVVAGRSDHKTPDPDTLWTPETKGPLTPTSPVVMSWDNGSGLVFRRTVKVDNNYMFVIADEVDNKTSASVTLFPYAAIKRLYMPKIEGFYIQHEGPIGVLGDDGLREVAYSELTKEVDTNLKKPSPASFTEKLFPAKKSGWIGITDKYWASALIPGQDITYDARMLSWREGGKDRFQVDYRQPGVAIAPGAKGSAETQVFAGAKDVRVVDAYKGQFGIKQFDSIIDWGTFWYITKPLFHLLDWINGLVKNFGVSILLITVLVKLVFFPLANKSYESMAKMKKLQPEMEKLRDRFKDDKARQQQELMKLYQEQKINPLAGCLPILVQIPVFFALYKILFISLDMRHAPFFGWIRDLSAPDPTSVFNLFGLLPLPAIDMLLLGHTIGAWAIIMGFTMWLQMQLNPPQPDPMQQAIFNWMPVMFTFMLGGFSSGLVIYWAWSNTLSIAQQWLIMKKNGVDVPLVDNLKKTLGALTGGVSTGIARLKGLRDKKADKAVK